MVIKYFSNDLRGVQVMLERLPFGLQRLDGCGLFPYGRFVGLARVLSRPQPLPQIFQLFVLVLDAGIPLA